MTFAGLAGERGGPAAETGLPDDQYFELLGRIATGDAKLVIANRFAAQPGEDFTGREFRIALEKFVPDGWLPDPRTISSYCELSLEPAGVVRHVGGTGPYRSRYQSTPYGASIGLGIGGVINPWSLENPDISTHHVFGISKTGSKLEVARSRSRILAYLIDKNEPVSEGDIVDDLDHEFPEFKVASHVRALAQHGLVEHTSKDQTYDPVFTLTEPKPRYGQIKQAQTRRLYDVLGELYSQGVQEVSFRQLLDRCIEGADPAIDAIQLRADLAIAAARSANIPCLTAQEPSRRDRTEVILKDKFREPIRLLFAELQEFRADPDRPDYREAALEIVTDGFSVRQLFDKWERTSSKVKQANGEEVSDTYDQIIAIISQGGAVTLSSVYEGLEKRNNGLSRETIKQRVYTLVDEGRLVRFRAPVDPTKKSQRQFFQLPEPNDHSLSR